jgi:hypothetical protein
MTRESSQKVCDGLAKAMRAFGIPEAILTDIQAGWRPGGARVVRPAV